MPARPATRIPFIATVVVGIPVAVLLAGPQAFTAQMAPFVAQVIAFRSALTVALALLAVVAACVAVVRRRWGIAAGIGIVLGAASLASGSPWRVREVRVITTLDSGASDHRAIVAVLDRAVP